MTAQFWLWIILSGLGGGIVGWWTRGRQVSGRELTIRRELNNRVCAVEDDAKRSLARARAEAESQRLALTEERDALRVRIAELESSPPPTVPAEDTEPGEAGPGPTPAARASGRPSRRPRTYTRPPEAPAAASVSRAHDDLKRIKGIGPAFERVLNDLGYSTFDDVARWDPAQIERLSQRLGARIRLEDWSAQAGELEQHGK